MVMVVAGAIFDFLIFTSVVTTRGPGIISVIRLSAIATFFRHSHFLEDFKINKAQILTF